MARNLTWCLKRTAFFTKCLNPCRQPMPLLIFKRNVIQRGITEKYQNKVINVDYDEPKDFQSFVTDSKCGLLVSVETLMKILNVTKATATQAVDINPNFKDLSKATIYKNFQILRHAKVYKSTIKDNTFLLSETTDTLMKKVDIIKRMDIDMNDAVQLFQLSVAALIKFEYILKLDARYLPARHRIQYLSEKLRCDVSKICYLINYNTFMLKLPAPKLLSITEYILEVGMKPEHIMKDLQIYKYSIDTIKCKIKRAMDLNIQPLKPWVVRCHSSIWEKKEDRFHEKITMLKPDETVTEYIAKMFECDIETAEYTVQKDPTLLIMNLQKLTDMATLLRDRGYTIHDIQRSPRLLHRSYTTVLRRFIEWEKLSDRQLPLCKIVITEKEFQDMLAQTRAKNEKEKSS